MNEANGAVRAFLDGLAGDDIPLRLSWEQWLDIGPPHDEAPFEIREVTARTARNGYDWDIHGRLYTPETAADPDG